MANICYVKKRRNEFHKNVCAKDRVQDKNFNQLKLKVNDTYEEAEIATNFEPSNDEDVRSKAYLDTRLSEVEAHISFIEKNRNEFGILKASVSTLRRFYFK